MNDEPSLDPALLRSFLAVAETLQFTAAARRRGLSQSTISQHVGRLEQLVGRILLMRNTKSASLTSDGEEMAELARDIIAAHDRAITHFDRRVIRGRVRFGVSEDLVLSLLPEILRAFRGAHPLVDVDLVVGLSSHLYEKLGTGQLDLLFAKRQQGDARGTALWRERLVWLGGPGVVLDPGQPVPLVVFPKRSITRTAAIDALNAAGREWHVAFTSDSLAGLVGAVRAGFGITAQTSLLAGANMQVPASAGLPALAETEFVVLGRVEKQGATGALAKAIMSHAELRRARIDFGFPAGPRRAAGDGGSG